MKRWLYGLLYIVAFLESQGILAMEQEKQVAPSATAMELEAPADTSATAIQPENRDISSLAAHIAENNLKKPKLEKDHSPYVLGVSHPF